MLIEQLSSAIKKVSGNAGFQAALELEGLAASVGSEGVFGEYVKQEEVRSAKIIQ